MRTVEQIKSDIEKVTKARDSKLTPEPVKVNAEKKIQSLNKELKEVEAAHEKAEAEKKAAHDKAEAEKKAAHDKAEAEKKAASDKRKENISDRKETRKLRKEISEFTHKGKKVSIPDMNVKESNQIAPGVNLIKMADNTYIIQEKDNKWSEMEIQKKAEGKWTVTCRTNENKTFKSLGDAVTHVVATLTKEVYKEKIDKARKAKKYREELKKHPVTPAETLKKAAETVENKIKKNRSRAVIMAAIKETKKILKGLYEELKEAKE